MQTPRELVTRSLTFDSPHRLPRDIWVLPWFERHYPAAWKEILRDYPPDIEDASDVYHHSSRVQGDPYAVGEYTDEWGCSFVNAEEGIIGQVKEPQITSLADLSIVRPPYEVLPSDPDAARDRINRACDKTDAFVKARCCPKPWERYQFLRGTVEGLLDTRSPDKGMRKLLQTIHEFYLRELSFWVTTDVNAIMFADDWGSQTQLLIRPSDWRELFKPLYKEYCDLAHAHGKFAFMHSDGYIMEIVGDLVEIGVDALNAQVFCMERAELEARAKGRITFWGEIDRQHVLPSTDPQVGRDAVREFARHFCDPRGGVIVQFECGPGARPETVRAVLEEWDAVQH